MAHYIKILKDFKKRQTFSSKLRRCNQLNEYLCLRMKKKIKNNFKNYCQMTGSGRSNYIQFSLSRHSFRKLSSFGMVPGVLKSSW